MSSKKWLLRSLSILFTLLLIVFVFRYFTAILHQVDFKQVNLNLPLTLLASSAFIGFYILLAIHWLWACRIVDNSITSKQYLSFFASQPYKYLPSSLFTFSFRAIYAKRLGLSIGKSSVAQVIENASMILSNLYVFLTIYLLNLSLIYGLVLILVTLAMIYLMAKQPPINMKIRSIKTQIYPKSLIKIFLVSSAAWIFSGLAFIILGISLGVNTDLLRLMAANTLAFSAGIVAVFAPGGIGVRELVFELFSVTGIVIAAWRMLTLILDLVLGVAAILLIKHTKK